MKALVDTNVIIDILEKREPFFEDSYRIIQLGVEGKLDTFMSAQAVTGIYDVIRQNNKNTQKAKEKIFSLTSLINVCDITRSDINNALTLYISDFDIAVISAIAKREKADYIITRNEADFSGSPVPGISPGEFLKKFAAGGD